MRARRVDANQQRVIRELRQLGISVVVTSALGSGFPDLCLGWHKRNYLVELKDPGQPPSQRKLTKDEADFFRVFKGHIIIATSTDEIIKEIARHECENIRTAADRLLGKDKK